MWMKKIFSPFLLRYSIPILFSTRLLAGHTEAQHLDSIAARYMLLIQQEKKDTSRIRIWVSYGNSIAWIFPDSARSVFLRTLDSSHIAKYDRGIAISLMALGTLYINRGISDTSLSYNMQALEYAKRIQPANYSLVSKIYSNIATLYTEAGAYKEAVKFHYQAVAFADRSASAASQASGYNNLATVLDALGEYKKSLVYIQKGKKLAETDKKAMPVLPYLLLNEASIYLNNGDFLKAKSIVEELLRQNNGPHPPAILNDIHETLGKIAALQDKPDEAIRQYSKGLEIAAGYPLGKMHSLYSLATIYLKINNYTLCERSLLAALGLATDLKDKKALKDIYASMAILYKSTKRYDKAYSAIEKSSLLKDSLINIERILYTNTLETQYQTAKKDKEISEKKLFIRQQQDRLTKKNVLIGSLAAIILVIISGFLLFLYYRQKIQKQKAEIKAWQAMNEGEEKERARIARELHDGIGGLLSTVKMYFDTIQKQSPALAGSNDYGEAMQLLDNTLTEVRNTAHNLMPELLLRDGLAECIRVLCHTISKKGPPIIDFQYYGFIGRLKSSFELSCYRIIQELVHNILKHSKATAALVQLSQHDDILSITVEDNGIGAGENAVFEKGMGLKNVRQRVTGLHGSFNIQCGKGKGTSVHLEFNLKKYKNLTA